jgi:RNA recognition motif-containing protein
MSADESEPVVPAPSSATEEYPPSTEPPQHSSHQEEQKSPKHSASHWKESRSRSKSRSRSRSRSTSRSRSSSRSRSRSRSASRDKRESAPPKQSASRLYVGNLENQVSEIQLRELFGECGRIVSVALKGPYAFVELETASEAERAITQFHGTIQFGGKRIIVEKSMDPKKCKRKRAHVLVLNCMLFSSTRIEWRSMLSLWTNRPLVNYFLR